jgi:phosphoglycolate phosphatase-like HAD superfamily hydrolase
MAYTSILLEIMDHVATVTLNRPEKLNALNGVLLRELDEVLAELDGNDDVRVIVVTGAGRHFAQEPIRRLALTTRRAKRRSESWIVAESFIPGT